MSQRFFADIRGHAPGDGHGTDGNARLTAITGSVLFILLAVEGVTILSLTQLLTVHAFIGVLLIPPILLKLSSTGYRFVKYYARDAAYRAAGPPATALRMLAPVLIVLTVVLFGSGVLLVVDNAAHGSVLFTVHKLSFILWFVVAGVHILYYLVRIPRIVGAEVRAGHHQRSAAHRGLRFAVLSGALVIGLICAIAIIPGTHTWERSHYSNISGRLRHATPQTSAHIGSSRWVPQANAPTMSTTQSSN